MSQRMELPKYAVPESLLSSQPGPSSHGDHTLQEPLDKTDDPGRHSKATGKRKRTGASSDPMKSGIGHAGPPQYAVPEYLLSPQTVYTSRRELTLQAPLNEIIDPGRHNNHITTPHSEPSIPEHSRSESMFLALDRSSLPPSTIAKPLEEHLRNMAPTGQSVPESPNLAYRTTAKDLCMKDDGFLDSFFPTPAMTDPWGEAPPPNLSWNSAAGLPFLLDEDMSMTEPDATVAEMIPERSEMVPDRRVSDAHNTGNTAVSQLDSSALTGERLSHVLKAVSAAGFSSLDDAVVAYYAEFCKDDERLRQAQRLNRIRRLPVLLKELHLAAQGWGQWQRRSFQEQIIKSAEDIVIAELEEQLLARRHDHYSSTCSTEKPCQACKQKAREEIDTEAELPNTWTLLTSLSTRYNAIASKDRHTDVPKLISKFLDGVTDLGI
ncbi:hypothetical protein BU25DRAFT_89066 [Macroventuria anomochaeta]|uniref:Uncharacterized protein n=1 Tax=Macroventuria anomochaeta TaxID=301207 RepID=A0ACB6SG17_9PLEO|nr:uncharacterized protein BU25DRAFT_89066 [Macroventuria anomochaeta]KAF2633116.1 hypothetical protein BU25DRAFT_89066 [Macroventuria anomochaeta]